MTKRVGIRMLLVAAMLLPMMVLVGCAGKELQPKHGIWYYHPELPAADRAVEDARKAGKDKECPAEFDMVEKMLEESYMLYKRCQTKKAISLANETAEQAKALCPQPPDPCRVCVECAECRPPAAEPKVFNIDNAHFDFDKSALVTASRQKTAHNFGELQKAIDFIKSHPGATIVVEGHTDSKGTDEYNQRLSERRAMAVKEYIVREGGVNPALISIRGYGESRPVASNKTEAGRARNRRAVIIVNPVH